MDYAYIVIVHVIDFFLLHKGHVAEKLAQKALFLLYFHFPIENSCEPLINLSKIYAITTVLSLCYFDLHCLSFSDIC